MATSAQPPGSWWPDRGVSTAVPRRTHLASSAITAPGPRPRRSRGGDRGGSAWGRPPDRIGEQREHPAVVEVHEAADLALHVHLAALVLELAANLRQHRPSAGEGGGVSAHARGGHAAQARARALGWPAPTVASISASRIAPSSAALDRPRALRCSAPSRGCAPASWCRPWSSPHRRWCPPFRAPRARRRTFRGSTLAASRRVDAPTLLQVARQVLGRRLADELALEALALGVASAAAASARAAAARRRPSSRPRARARAAAARAGRPCTPSPPRTARSRAGKSAAGGPATPPARAVALQNLPALPPPLILPGARASPSRRRLLTRRAARRARTPTSSHAPHPVAHAQSPQQNPSFRQDRTARPSSPAFDSSTRRAPRVFRARAPVFFFFFRRAFFAERCAAARPREKARALIDHPAGRSGARRAPQKKRTRGARRKKARNSAKRQTRNFARVRAPGARGRNPETADPAAYRRTLRSHYRNEIDFVRDNNTQYGCYVLELRLLKFTQTPNTALGCLKGRGD